MVMSKGRREPLFGAEEDSENETKILAAAIVAAVAFCG